MRKTYSLIFASALLILSLFASVSASVFTYDHYYQNAAPTISKYSSERVYDSYGNEVSAKVVKTVNSPVYDYSYDYTYNNGYNNNYNNYYPSRSISFSRNYNPYRDNDRVYVVHHQITCDAYGYNDCSSGDYSSFRQKPVYSYLQYGDDQYTYPYYYQPKYNYNQGYYDWRY